MDRKNLKTRFSDISAGMHVRPGITGLVSYRFVLALSQLMSVLGYFSPPLQNVNCVLETDNHY